MKSVKNFISLKVPDHSAYEQRHYSDVFRYEEHERFRWRCTGGVASLLSLVFFTCSIHFRSHWVKRQGQSDWSSLWDSCYILVANQSQYPHELEHFPCHQYTPDWQKAIIGLVLFSLAFSLMGAILAMLGLCISYLPRKMYYYHSAGEIFFVSALATTVAVGIYPYAVQKMLLQSHYFGYGYGLGWATACLLYLSAFTMMMDDLVRESSRPRPIQVLFCCCRKSSPDSSYPQPV